MKLTRVDLDGTSWMLVGRLARSDADRVVNVIEAHPFWERRLGRRGVEPRDTAMYGIGFSSRSSYRTAIASPPIPLELSALTRSLSIASETAFNAALLNRYLSGRDSVAWHNDLEPHIVGPEPVIASVSLGASRVFRLRSMVDHANARNVPLHHADVVIMCGRTQHDWEHCVPKTARPVGVRWTVTFREYDLATAGS